MPFTYIYKKCRKPMAILKAGKGAPKGSPEDIAADNVLLMADALATLHLLCHYAKITEKNARDVYVRIALAEQLYGNYLATSKGPRPITPQDVRDFVGFEIPAANHQAHKASLRQMVQKWVDRETKHFTRKADEETDL